MTANALPANAGERQTSSRSSFAAGAVIIIATLLAYLPALRAGFIWDDDDFLTGNVFIRQTNGLWHFWFSRNVPDYFPLTSTSLWLEWRLWGMNAMGYHLTNVLLHALSAVVWWRVLERLKMPGAWLAAAIFALHPVNVESVAWITERKNTLAMVFYALTVWSFLKSEPEEKCGWYWASVGSFLLALLSKTSVVTWPVAMLGLVWWRRGKIVRADFIRSVPFFVLSLGLGLMTVWFQGHGAVGDDIARQDGLASRLAVAGRAVWFYLWKAVWPVDLSFVYPRWELGDVNVMAFLPLVLLFVTLGAGWLWRERLGRGFVFGLMYYAVLLLPVLGFVNVYFMKFSLVADHWQYFSIVAVAAIAAVVLEKFSGHWLWVPGAALLLALGVLTWRQSTDYADVDTLWRATLARNPRSHLALSQSGVRLLLRGRAAEAEEFFRRALAVNPRYTQAYYSLGNALWLQGRMDEAVASFRAAVDCRPDFFPARASLGELLTRRGEIAEAIGQYQRALEIVPGNIAVRTTLAELLCRENRLPEAVAELRTICRSRPDAVPAWENLGSVLAQLGRLDEAEQSFRRSLSLKPDSARACNNLGGVLSAQGRLREAAEQTRRALEIDPASSDAMENLNNTARTLATHPDPAQRDAVLALKLAQFLVRITTTNNPAVLATLAHAQAGLGNYSAAVVAGERAWRLAQSQTNSMLATELEAQLVLFRSRTSE